MHKLFTVCTEHVRFPYTEHAASGLPNPTHLEGEVRFIQAHDKQVFTTFNFHQISTFLYRFQKGTWRLSSAANTPWWRWFPVASITTRILSPIHCLLKKKSRKPTYVRKIINRLRLIFGFCWEKKKILNFLYMYTCTFVDIAIKKYYVFHKSKHCNRDIHNMLDVLII